MTGMRHDKRKSKPKGRLAKRLKSVPRTRTFRNAKGIVCMPPLDYTFQVLEALDQLPMEVRMRPEMRLRGYDNWRMG